MGQAQLPTKNLLMSGGSFGQTLTIGTALALRAQCCSRRGNSVVPPNVSPAIGENQRVAVIMAVSRESRKIIPILGGGVGDEKAIIYGRFVLVQKYK